MPRYFVDENNIKNLIIDNDNFHHLAIVNRVKVGEEVELFSNDITYKVKITKINKDSLNFEIVDEYYFNTEFNFKVTLLQAYPKGDKLESIIKHSTELGVYEIIPTITSRTIVKIEDNKKDNKLKRLNQIAIEASKQSRRNYIPKILDIKRLNEINYDNYNVKILAYEVLSTEENNKKFVEVVNSIKENDNVIIAIGPEGGFSNDEANYLIDKGFIPVSLGKRILRTETAGLYCLSVIGALKEWE